MRYQRILLKLGGEALAEAGEYGIHPPTAERLARMIATTVRETGVEMAIVLGGGNIWRGATGSAQGMDRPTADYIGMLGTVLNALALQEALERVENMVVRVQTAIEMRAVAEPYIRRRAANHLEDGKLVIFAAGSGNPFFTTDTAGALRAMEIGAQALFKGTNVDGVYDRDPSRYPDARRFGRLSYIEAVNRRVGVMDSTAITLCMEHNLPILVFKLDEPGSLRRAILGERIGTLIASPDWNGAAAAQSPQDIDTPDMNHPRESNVVQPKQSVGVG